MEARSTGIEYVLVTPSRFVLREREREKNERDGIQGTMLVMTKLKEHPENWWCHFEVTGNALDDDDR